MAETIAELNKGIEKGYTIETFSPTAVSDYATVNSNFSGTSYRYKDELTGHTWVHLSVCYQITASPSGAVFGQIPSGYRPKYKQAIVSNAVGGACVLTTSGNISGYASVGYVSINIDFLVS